MRNPYGDVANFFNQDTTIIGLLTRCFGQNINLVGTYIIDLGTFPKNYNIGPSKTGKVDVVANTPSRKTYYCSVLIEEVGYLPIRIS